MNRGIAWFILVCMGACTGMADIDNVIKQHNRDLELGTHYNINQYTQQIQIKLAVSGEVFEFEARLEEDTVDIGPGDINYIYADEDAGNVALTIVGHDGHTYGARNVQQINLVASGVQSTILGLDISGDLGELDPVLASVITGPFIVGDDILDDIEVVKLLLRP